MDVGKNEAQIRNEEEVRRILKERGYSSKESKKHVAETFGFNFKPIAITLLVSGLIIGSWFFLESNLFGQSRNSSTFNNSKELNDFNNCLESIESTDIAVDDPEFWNKYITRYELTISCYDRFSSVASLTEKNNLHNKLDDLREKSKNAESNNIEYRQSEAESEKQYQETIRKSKTNNEIDYRIYR